MLKAYGQVFMLHPVEENNLNVLLNFVKLKQQ